jgi:hypothetical protein
MGDEADVVDVSATINHGRIGRIQIIVVAVSALVAVLDGLDLHMIGLAAPAIAKDLTVPAGALGAVFSVALGGLGIGRSRSARSPTGSVASGS